jgi:hypothetical protein
MQNLVDDIPAGMPAPFATRVEIPAVSNVENTKGIVLCDVKFESSHNLSCKPLTTIILQHVYFTRQLYWFFATPFNIFTVRNIINYISLHMLNRIQQYSSHTVHTRQLCNMFYFLIPFYKFPPALSFANKQAAGHPCLFELGIFHFLFILLSSTIIFVSRSPPVTYQICITKNVTVPVIVILVLLIGYVMYNVETRIATDTRLSDVDQIGSDR